MIEVDSDVKLSGIGTKARAKMHAKNHGRFVKAGCSQAPAHPPKVKNARYVARHPLTVETEPFSLFNRRLKLNPATAKARDHARHIGIPSYQGEKNLTAATMWALSSNG